MHGPLKLQKDSVTAVRPVVNLCEMWPTSEIWNDVPLRSAAPVGP